MLKMQKGSKYEYADVYPLVYLKISLEGVQGFHDVKHLVIDEMQDYRQADAVCSLYRGHAPFGPDLYR